MRARKTRSLAPLVRGQAWKCYQCGKQGSVPYTSDSGVWEVCQAMWDQHRAIAPECPDGAKIRLLPNKGAEAGSTGRQRMNKWETPQINKTELEAGSRSLERVVRVPEPRVARAYHLAMLCLQSDFYHKGDNEVKNLVDDLIGWSAPWRRTEAPQGSEECARLTSVDRPKPKTNE